MTESPRVSEARAASGARVYDRDVVSTSRLQSTAGQRSMRLQYCRCWQTAKC
jgi:hypothetical protein